MTLVLLLTGKAQSEEWLELDEQVTENFSPRAASLSDFTLNLSLFLPLYPTSHLGSPERKWETYQHFGVAHLANYTLTYIVKTLAARPRPFTKNSSQGARDLRAEKGEGYSSRSFFSGHSSAAYTSSSLVSHHLPQKWNAQTARYYIFMQFLAAGSTAALRVTAGRHYYTDVWVGSFFGLALGKLVADRGIQSKDKEKYFRIGGGEYRAVAIASILGFAWPHFVNLESSQIEATVSPEGGPLLVWKRRF